MSEKSYTPLVPSLKTSKPLKEQHREEVAALLAMSDLTTVALAANSGRTRPTISAWLTGGRDANVTLDFLDDLYRALWQDHRSKVRRLLDEAGVKQADAAKMAKVPARDLGAFLRGGPIDAHTLKRLYAALAERTPPPAKK